MDLRSPGSRQNHKPFPNSVKLQSAGPGSRDGSVLGSVIDGSAIGGDTTLADDWRTKIESLFVALPDGTDVPTWLGNSTVFEGQIIYLLAFSTNQYKNNDFSN